MSSILEHSLVGRQLDDITPKHYTNEDSRIALIVQDWENKRKNAKTPRTNKQQKEDVKKKKIKKENQRLRKAGKK